MSEISTQRRFWSCFPRVACLALLAALGFSLPVGAATIVLDPGHGGHDPGGIPGQRVSEKQAALDVALRVRARLQAAGQKVVMTRSSDVFVELSQRVAASKRAPAKALFVSIHFNSAPNRQAHGIETYHFDARSRRLAEAIHRRVVAATGEEDRGVRRARFYVLRTNRRTAVLAELGFLTNPQEGGRVARSSAYRQKLANAVASGVLSMVH
ncbi:MAG: N-acetylmuramoyl-L-alanine amidase [Verrucomicrobia bacterium]|nr:MAG: N-acetylmuramoyl-L-alanine amidase [Verrucomicrobiota bacterium]